MKTREEDQVDEGRDERAGMVARSFPWIVGVMTLGAATAAIIFVSDFAAELGDLAVGQVAAVESPAPASEPEPAPQLAPSPYAHLQDQVEPKKMTTIHEGGPVGLMSLNAKLDDAPFCDASHWSRNDIVKQVSPGQVFVDQADWEQTPAGTQSRLASWMSKCTQDGDEVQIMSGSSGSLLATYSPSNGLTRID